MPARKGFYDEIRIVEDYGSAEGYVVSVDRQNIENFLLKHAPDEQTAAAIAGWLRANRLAVAVITHLSVEDHLRGKGFGNVLMGKCFAAVNAAAADTILLVSDNGEIQAEGFDLEKWYAGFDFDVVARYSAGALMAHPLDTAYRLREVACHSRTEA